MTRVDFEAVASNMGRAMLVLHVATRPLHTAHASEDVAHVIAWACPAGINNVPVLRDGTIVGVIENINADYPGVKLPPNEGSAWQAMRPLHAGMLLESGTPLADLLPVLLEPPHYRLVLDGSQADAIVTPSDLVKLPMRILVFAAVANLESALLDALRRLYASDEDACQHLDADSQTQVLDSYDKLRAAHLDPSLLEVVSLRQKARLLAARGVFGGEDPVIEAEFEDLVSALRNPIVHAAGYVDDSLDALRGLERRLQAVRLRTDQADRAKRPGV
jgi:hypothetical protein